MPADLKEGAFSGMQNQKAGFGMFLKVLHTRVSPSVFPHGTTRLPLEGFSCNLMFEDFSKICQRKVMFTEIGQE